MRGGRWSLVVGGLGVVVVVAGVTAVSVGGARHHGDDGDGAEADCRQPEPRLGGSHRPARSTAQRHDCGAHRQRAKGGADGVGELGRLGLLEALDPRDARHPRDDPGDDGTAIDQCSGRRDGAAATQQRDQPDEDLRSGDGDEQPRQRLMLSVNPDGGGVDGPSPQRGDPLQRCDPTRVGGRCARRLIALLGRWSRRRTVVVWFAHTDDGKTGDEPVKSGKSPDRSLRP